MQKVQNLGKMQEIRKIGKESNLHIMLKLSCKNILHQMGYETMLEENTIDKARVDVLGLKDSKFLVIECETLSEMRKRISSTIQKANIKFGNADLVLCIPNFSNLKEVWVVKDSGYIERFTPKVGGEENG